MKQNFEKYGKNNGLTFNDLMFCPECGSGNCACYSNQKIGFIDYEQKLLVHAQCKCLECKTIFDIEAEFDYEIRSSSLTNKKTKDIF